MNVDLPKLWLSHLDGHPLTTAQRRALVEQISDQKIAAKLLEDRQLDGLLKLMAESESDQQRFTAECLQAFQDQQAQHLSPATPDHEIAGSPAATSHLLDPVVDHSSVSIQAVQTAESRRGASKRTVTQSSRLALVLALSLLLPLLGVAWWLQAEFGRSNNLADHRPAESADGQSNVLDEALSSQDHFQMADDAKNEPMGDRQTSGTSPQIALHHTDLVGDPTGADDGSVAKGGSPGQPQQRVAPGDAENTAAIATVTSSPSARWARAPTSNQLNPGRYVLDDGSARLDFLDGSTVQVNAPAVFQVKSPHHIHVDHGNITASIAPDSHEFAVSSPVADFKRGANSQFQLSVSPDGRSEALLHRGSLDLVKHQRSSQDKPDDAEPWKLDARQLNQVMVNFAEEDAAPALCMARGNDRFRGSIDVGGNAIELDSPEMFNDVVDRINSARTTSPSDFQEQWDSFAQRYKNTGLVGSVQNNEGRQPIDSFAKMFDIIRDQQKKMRDTVGNQATQFQGIININGRQQQFDSIDDLRRMQAELLGPMFDQMPPQQGNSNSGFQGVININGREMKFTSPEEFRKAQQQFFRK